MLQPISGAPLTGLTPSELDRFEAGMAAFGRQFLTEEGLGPGFNKAGCFSCHTVPLGGWGTTTVTRFGFADKGFFDPLVELGGPLLQAAAISDACIETLPPAEIANVTTQRVTNSSLAFGLIEAIPDEDILANADPNDLDGDGISGRARLVEAVEDGPGSPLRVGRFGWKAQVATVLTFSADAALNEMGITNRFFQQENAPNGDLKLLAACDQVPDPEDFADPQGFEFIDRVTDFQRFLGPPPQTPKSGMTGEALFVKVGCAQCHIPEWTTADSDTLEDAIRNKTIRPYSDFLLHDMGILGDGIVDGNPEEPDSYASDLELRTPTLWNLRTRDPMLHDGRAGGGSFFERVAGPGGAIWWHDQAGSEARPSAQAFFALSIEEQEAVVAFLDSLGRREFDADGNDGINIVDFLDFKSCFGGEGYTPDDPCAIHDVDQDGNVDEDDFALFLSVYGGIQGDCNRNGVNDLEDILLGTSVDENLDGIPDECLVCFGDLDASGAVDGADLGVLFAAWGGADPVADLDGSGKVDGADLGALLASWGECG